VRRLDAIPKDPEANLTQQPTPTRNDTVEFCRRTRRNLGFIENALQNDPNAPVHAVTQLTLSLLGIVVFPYEKLDETIFYKTVTQMKSDGWCGWSIMLDKPKKAHETTRTLGDLLRHLRNAVAHGRLRFSSDISRFRLAGVNRRASERRRPAGPFPSALGRIASNIRPPLVYPPITNSAERLIRILRQAPERAPGL
jgi:hypothetical protein